ncbi:MAG: hypothetical protein LBS74_08020 [Oscillospiraceae bacterium]|jgi:hypothetical protein|nr:hypothetical protein [Oscillospiraceae bacterium]
MIFREATPEDGAAMLELIESHPSKGALKLVYTRRENPYYSYMADCPHAEMTLAADDNNIIHALMVCLPRQMYINGELRTVGYVTGLHKREGSRVNLIRLFDYALRKSKGELFFCSLLEENGEVLNMLQKRHSRVPYLYPLCEYKTFMLGCKGGRGAGHSHAFRKAERDDEIPLIEFFNAYGRGHSFFPKISSLEGFCGLKTEDYYLMLEKGKIIAAAAVWNQQAYKQYIALDYSGLYSVLQKLGLVLSALGYPKIPTKGSAVNFAYISFFAVNGDDEAVSAAFLAELMAASAVRWDTLCIGAALGSVIEGILSKKRSISFGSRLCLLDPAQNGSALNKGEGLPFFECGLL